MPFRTPKQVEDGKVLKQEFDKQQRMVQAILYEVSANPRHARVAPQLLSIIGGLYNFTENQIRAQQMESAEVAKRYTDMATTSADNAARVENEMKTKVEGLNATIAALEKQNEVQAKKIAEFESGLLAFKELIAKLLGEEVKDNTVGPGDQTCSRVMLIKEGAENEQELKKKVNELQMSFNKQAIALRTVEEQRDKSKADADSYQDWYLNLENLFLPENQPGAVRRSRTTTSLAVIQALSNAARNRRPPSISSVSSNSSIDSSYQTDDGQSSPYVRRALSSSLNSRSRLPRPVSQSSATTISTTRSTVTTIDHETGVETVHKKPFDETSLLTTITERTEDTVKEDNNTDEVDSLSIPDSNSLRSNHTFGTFSSGSDDIKLMLNGKRITNIYAPPSSSTGTEPSLVSDHGTFDSDTASYQSGSDNDDFADESAAVLVDDDDSTLTETPVRVDTLASLASFNEFVAQAQAEADAAYEAATAGRRGRAHTF